MGHGESALSSEIEAEIDRWYHVAWTYENGIGSMFVDGVLVNRGALEELPTTSQPIRIGTARYRSLSDWAERPYDFFTGLIDDVSVYNVALSEVAIAQMARIIFDRDADGMLDGWELIHGLDSSDATDAQGDLDDDGQTNLEEFLSGTDPGRSDSKLEIKDVRLVEAGEAEPTVEISFTSLPGLRYALEIFSGEKWAKIDELIAMDETAEFQLKLPPAHLRYSEPLLRVRTDESR